MIRKMNVDDLSRIVELERQLFELSWSYEDFLYELQKNPFACYLVKEHDYHIVGYIGLWFLGDQCQITTLAVERDYHRRGFARELMQEAIRLTKEMNYPVMSLEVRVSNQPAISLYESFGFINKAVRKNYYQNNHEDAYLMIKEVE